MYAPILIDTKADAGLPLFLVHRIVTAVKAGALLDDYDRQATVDSAQRLREMFDLDLQVETIEETFKRDYSQRQP
jgi:hypothetical protein